MFDLKGNVAAVTGASGGLGRQFALALAKQGADIALMARRKENMEEVAEEIRALGVKCLPVVCDVTDPDNVDRALSEILKEYGKVDILVNNAGGGDCIPAAEMTPEQWRKVTSLDFDGTFFCMSKFGKVMTEAGYGRIINIASILGNGSLKEIPVVAYAASKGGVIQMTRQAAAEWGTKGVTVNAIAPGFFGSQANDPAAMEAMDGFITARTAMCRAGWEGELDTTVVYLAAKESTYVTGTVAFCDGGWNSL